MMLTHYTLSNSLTKEFKSDRKKIDLEPVIQLPLELQSLPFSSEHTEVYPAEDYHESSSLFKALLRFYLDKNAFSDKFLFHHLQLSDNSIRENNSFTYHLIKPKKEGPFNGAILLFHGLNSSSKL